jgi:hypothetical protein
MVPVLSCQHGPRFVLSCHWEKDWIGHRPMSLAAKLTDSQYLESTPALTYIDANDYSQQHAASREIPGYGVELMLVQNKMLDAVGGPQFSSFTVIMRSMQLTSRAS